MYRTKTSTAACRLRLGTHRYDSATANKEEKERVAFRGRKWNGRDVGERGREKGAAAGAGELKWTQVAPPPPPPPLRDWMKLQIEILDVRAQRTHRQAGNGGRWRERGEEREKRREGGGRAPRESTILAGGAGGWFT